MLRRATDAALAGLGAIAFAAYAVRWLDTTVFPLVVVQSLAPVAGLGVLLLTLVAVLSRRRRTARVGLAFSLVVLLVSAPSLGSQQVSPRPGDLVVMSANLEFGQADPAALMAEVTARQVDILVLLEVTPRTAARLAELGLDRLLAHEVGGARDGADGTVIRSRFPLTPVNAPTFPGETDLFQPAARADVDGRPLIIRAVHPFPPTPPNLDFWRSGLAGLAGWTRAQLGGIPVVLAGDFNSSADHPVFRDLAEGLVDAHAATGWGWAPTWPQDRRWIRPFVQIDHVLARGLQATAAGVIRIPDTDHAAVWASWSWPPAG